MTSGRPLVDIERSDCRYAPFYCEENVWHLCGAPQFTGVARYALFISSPSRACALWAQRASSEASIPVLWDYHVALLARSLAGPTWDVWDIDSRAAFGGNLADYLTVTFWPLRGRYDHLAPRFIAIEGERYLAEFSSDRSHMCDSTGAWLQSPPSWPAIVRPHTPSFLRWTTMNEGNSMSLDALRERFGEQPNP